MVASAKREMSSSIQIRTLTDGGQQPLEIARLVAEFLGAAKRSLDLAQYDFNLGPETREFVARDGETIWTGSMNWTDDSWSRQENLIVTVDSGELARAFTLAFDELWETGDVEQSGRVEPRPVDVGDTRVKPWFTPGNGEALSPRIAKKIAQAKHVRICPPVITAAPVLATLAQVLSDGKAAVAGCVDATQVDEVIRQWRANPQG